MVQINDELLDGLCGKDLIAFGTGKVGKAVIPYLSRCDRLRLCGVTNSSISDDKEVMFGKTGLAMRSIDQWKCRFPEATILITALKPRMQREIFEVCQNAGFQDVKFISMELMRAIRLAEIEESARQVGSPFAEESDHILLDRIRLMHPSKFGEHELSFWNEVSEFILPTLYPDWAVPENEEGPYEWGKCMLSHGDVVLDCGANLGMYSAYAAAKGCTAYAFEPTMELLPMIERHGALNGGNVIPIEAAVSNETGKTSFYICKNSSEANSLIAGCAEKTCETLEEMEEVQVGTITIDDFVREKGLTRVDFIKADIEGAERYMLQGAKETLRRFAPNLSICTYHLPDDKETLTKIILDANPNYEIEYRWKKLFAYVAERNSGEGGSIQ